LGTFKESDPQQKNRNRRNRSPVFAMNLRVMPQLRAIAIEEAPTPRGCSTWQRHSVADSRQLYRRES
jgi:hypothetical protein